MDSKKKALRVLIVIMMILSSMSLIAIMSANVSATAILSIQINSEDTSSKTIYPNGPPITYKIDVTNYGQGGNINITNSTPPTGWNAYLDQTLVYLDGSGGTATVTLTVDCPNTQTSISEEGQYAQITVTANEVGAAPENAKQITTTTTIGQEYGISLANKTGDPYTKTPDQFGKAEFDLTVNNTGNGKDYVSWATIGEPGTVVISPGNVNPFSEKNFNLRISNIPDDIKTGIHSTKVTAFSENNSYSGEFYVDVYVPPVYELALSTEEGSKKFLEPGETIYFNFSIRNKGNDEDEIDITTGFLGTADWWYVTPPVSPYSIAANETKIIKLEVSSPTNQTYPKIVEMYLNVSSNYNISIFQNTTIKAEISQICDVDISTSPIEFLINQKVSFNITVKNDGNGEDTIEFEKSGNFPVGELWYYSFIPESITLPTKGRGTVFFNVTGPEDADDGNFDLNLTAISNENPLMRDTSKCTIAVGENYAVKIISLNDTQPYVFPGEIYSIKIRVKNVGNNEDDIQLSGIKPLKAIGWELKFDPANFEKLQEGGTVYSYLNISVDDDAVEDVYNFTIKAKSIENPSKTSTFDMNITVKRKYEIELDVALNQLNADPGSSADFLFTVQNKGTGACNVTMEATMLDEYENYLSVQFEPSSFELPTATANRKVWVNITPSLANPLAPMNVTPGIPINIDADITEKDGGPEATKEIKVKINQTYDVGVFVNELYKNIEPGSTGFVIITVTNDGNGEDSFGITPTPPIAHPSWKVKANPTSTGKILQGENKDINITITIPITESVVTDNITLNVTSITDPTSSTSLEKTIIIKIEETKNYKFVATDYRKEVEPGSYVNFKVEIENTGTVDDTIKLDVVGGSSTHIGYELLSPSVAVKAKQRNSTILNISVSDSDIEELPEMDNITVEASNTESFILQRIFTIDITEVRAVSLLALPLEQEGKPNAKLIYNISISNTGTGKDKYTLSVLSNPPYSQWATLKTIDTKQLDPGEETFVDVEVKIPSKQSPSPPYGEITILAESKENSLKNDTVDLRVIVEQVFKVQVTPEPTTNKVDPGENVTFEISIQNTGSAQDTFELIDDRYENSDSILLASFSSRYLILEASETQIVLYTITAVKEPEAAKLIAKIRITAESLNDTADTPASDTEEIVVEVQPTVDIELQADKIKKDVTPELSGTKAEVTYDITIVNNGLADDKFDLSEINNHGFVVELPASPISVKEGESQVIIIKIIIDNNAPRSSFDYNTNITVTSRNDPDKFEIITLKTRILQTYGVELLSNKKTIETGEVLISNNRIVTFEIDVRNIGTGEDTIKFELIGDYSSWGTLNESSFDFSSKKPQKLEVEFKVPRETLEGDYSLILKAISRGDDDKYDDASDESDEIKLTVEVTQFYEVELDPGETMKTGEPGDTVDFNFFVTNRGNGEDTVDLQKRFYDIDWLWSLSQKSPKLQPTGDAVGGDKREIKLTVDIPTDENGKNGFYNISIFVYSTPPSGKEIQNNGQPIEFTVKVDPVYEMDIILDYPTSLDDQKADPGRKIDYKVTLKNKGNTRDTFKLSVTGSKSGWVDLPYSTVTIGEYKSRIINFTVNIPDLTEVDAEDIEAQKYQIKLRATSDGDSDKYDELILNPAVDKEYSVELEPTEIDIENNIGQLKANPNADPEYAEFSLTVKNEGNTLDKITLSATNTGDWTVRFKTTGSTMTSLPLSLAIGRSETVTVQVYPPTEGENGDSKTMTIQAKSDNGKITDTFKVQGTVETAKIVFKSFDVSDKEAGSKATIKLVVANDGDVEAEDLEIKFYDKGTLIKSEKIDNLDKRDQTEVQFTYEITEGDHEIRAETVWSSNKIKDTESFSSETELLSGNMLWIIIIIVAVVVFIIGVGLASVSYRRGIPPELREEIAMAKQASKMGKSTGEIKAMRGKRYEGPGALGEKKKPSFKPEKEMAGTGAEEEQEKPKKKSTGKVTRIKCPKCDKVQTVTSTKRPLEFPCSTCGMKLVLKK